MHSLLRITAVLVFLVAVVLAGCSKKDAAVDEIAKSLEKQDELVEMYVFYPGEDMIIEEAREIEKSKFGPEEAVRQIFETPRSGKEFNPVMPDTKVVGVAVDGGVATVNFERSVLNFEASKVNQQLVIAAIAKTLAQFPDVKQLKFKVEGLEEGIIDGKNVEDFWGEITLKNQPWKVQ